MKTYKRVNQNLFKPTQTAYNRLRLKLQFWGEMHGVADWQLKLMVGLVPNGAHMGCF